MVGKQNKAGKERVISVLPDVKPKTKKKIAILIQEATLPDVEIKAGENSYSIQEATLPDVETKAGKNCYSIQEATLPDVEIREAPIQEATLPDATKD